MTDLYGFRCRECFELGQDVLVICIQESDHLRVFQELVGDHVGAIENRAVQSSAANSSSCSCSGTLFTPGPLVARNWCFGWAEEALGIAVKNNRTENRFSGNRRG